MEKRRRAVEIALSMVTFPEITENAGNNCKAIPVEVEGDEIWVTFDATAKQWYDTAKTKAYDPFKAQAEWEETLADRKAKKEDREKKKAERLARQQTKREQAEKNKGKVIIEQE